MQNTCPIDIRSTVASLLIVLIFVIVKIIIKIIHCNLLSFHHCQKHCYIIAFNPNEKPVR